MSSNLCTNDIKKQNININYEHPFLISSSFPCVFSGFNVLGMEINKHTYAYRLSTKIKNR